MLLVVESLKVEQTEDVPVVLQSRTTDQRCGESDRCPCRSSERQRQALTLVNSRMSWLWKLLPDCVSFFSMSCVVLRPWPTLQETQADVSYECDNGGCNLPPCPFKPLRLTKSHSAACYPCTHTVRQDYARIDFFNRRLVSRRRQLLASQMAINMKLNGGGGKWAY